MESTLLLPGGNRCTLRFEAGALRAGGNGTSECYFEREPSAYDWQNLQLCAQVLFRQVFAYREAAKGVRILDPHVEDPARGSIW